MDRIKILTIRFKNPLAAREIPLFRGAVIKMTASGNYLFHGHIDEGFRYSYPLIQYKRINGCAAIVCVGDGTEAIGDFFSGRRLVADIGDTQQTLEIDTIHADNFLVHVWNAEYRYIIRRWLALNQDNYPEFTCLQDPAERREMLERILIGNILSFAKGLNVFFDKEIKLKIHTINSSRLYRYKEHLLMGFDVVFTCNVSIPSFVGLGKGTSIGFGTVNKRSVLQPEILSQYE